VAQTDPDFEPLLVTNRVFGGGFSSRLNQDLRETRGYTYGASSTVGTFRGVGLDTIAMDVQTPSTADAVGETVHDLDTLTASGVTPEELVRAREWLARSLPSRFDTGDSMMGTLRTLYLDDLPPDYFQSRPARLARITTDDVAAVAGQRFAAGAFTVVAVGDRAAIEGPLRALNLGPVSLRASEP
jgi:zinc protease